MNMLAFLKGYPAETQLSTSGRASRWYAALNVMLGGMPDTTFDVWSTPGQVPHLHAGDVGPVDRRVCGEHGRQRLHQQRSRDARLEVLPAVLPEPARCMRSARLWQ